MSKALDERLNLYKNSMIVVNWNNYDTKYMPTFFKNGVIPQELAISIMNHFYSYIINTIQNKNDILDDYYVVIESFKKYRSFVEDKSLKKRINSLIKEVESYINRVANEQLEDSRFFDILAYFVQQPDGLIYIKELIKRDSNIANSKKNGVHILVYTYKLFLDNYSKMCHDKNSDYLNKDTLKQIICLLSKNSRSLDTDDRDKINSLYYNFINDINFLRKQKRRDAASKEARVVSEVITKKVYPKHDTELREVNDNYMHADVANIARSFEVTNNYSRSTKVYEDAFTYNERNFAYSVYDLDNGYQVRIHLKNMDNYISYTSFIHNYLKNLLMNKQNPAVENETSPMLKVFRKEFDFKIDQPCDTICFVFDFDKKGRITNFDIKKSRVKLSEHEYIRQSDEYLMERIKTNRKLDVLNEIYLQNLFAGNVSSNVVYSSHRVNNFFRGILSNSLAKYMSDNKLPSLLYGSDKKLREKTNKHEENLGNVLARLEKEDYYKIENVLGSTINDKHYSYIYDPNFEYEIDILDSLSYLGLEIRKMITTLVFNERSLNDDKLKKYFDYYKNYFILLTHELNENMQAVDLADLEYFKGKLNMKKVKSMGNIKNIK